jgi:hypothetical protein
MRSAALTLDNPSEGAARQQRSYRSAICSVATLHPLGAPTSAHPSLPLLYGNAVQALKVPIVLEFVVDSTIPALGVARAWAVCDRA